MAIGAKTGKAPTYRDTLDNMSREELITECVRIKGELNIQHKVHLDELEKELDRTDLVNAIYTVR